MYIPSQIILSLLNFFSLSDPPSPTVQLDGVKVTGKAENDFNLFLGIPYAEPPTRGQGRFKLPQPKEYKADIDATEYQIACSQQHVEMPPGLPPAITLILDRIFPKIPPENGEDCLTINVIAPANLEPDANLPVVVWIFGGDIRIYAGAKQILINFSGGFQAGTPSAAIYNGSQIVQHGKDVGSPLIYVSINYRFSGWGFLAGSQVKEAGVGNLGLHDQRLALRWVQKYIHLFGGDPSRVTIWGASSGAISAGLHMVANDGDHENLFSGVFMQSGGPIPVGDLTNGQQYYDQIAEHTGCSGDNSLECLRNVDDDILRAAIDSTPHIFSNKSLNLAWLPRVDGVLFSADPITLVEQGKIANVPFVSGDVDDEATMFSLSSKNITTTEEFKSWIKETLLPGVTDAEVDLISVHYPANKSAGSPFDTGLLNALTPQYKRIAAFQGDAVFQGSRRFLLQQRALQEDGQDSWGFLSKRYKSTAYLGSFHGHDLLNVFGTGNMGRYLARFVATGNPNDPQQPNKWPKYTAQDQKLLSFQNSLVVPEATIDDNYRAEAIAYAFEVVRAHPL